MSSLNTHKYQTCSVCTSNENSYYATECAVCQSPFIDTIKRIANGSPTPPSPTHASKTQAKPSKSQLQYNEDVDSSFINTNNNTNIIPNNNIHPKQVNDRRKRKHQSDSSDDNKMNSIEEPPRKKRKKMSSVEVNNEHDTVSTSSISTIPTASTRTL
eukprot:985408_1